MTSDARQRHQAVVDGILLPGAPGWERDNYARLLPPTSNDLQAQTNATFTDKWGRYGESDEKERLYAMQRAWYLQLYGFGSEQALAEHLQSCRVVLDAGCGLGYKAAWFADLAPDTTVVGVDYSDAAQQAERESGSGHFDRHEFRLVQSEPGAPLCAIGSRSVGVGHRNAGAVVPSGGSLFQRAIRMALGDLR